MLLRRLTAAGVGIAGIALTMGVASAAPVTVTPRYAEAGAGTVSLTRTTDPATGDVDYDIVISGRIGDHGWGYTGELFGIRHATPSSFDTPTDIGSFDVTASPSGVSGRCSSYSTVGSTVSPSDPIDALFACVLSKNGSTPWLVQFQSTLLPAAADGSAWQGPFVETDAEATAISTTAEKSIGDVQVEERNDGGGLQYTVQFSGQVAIGSSVYTGEILSEPSGWFYLHDGEPTPTMAVAGIGGGHHVTGQCTGRAGGLDYDVSAGWDFDCSLSLDSAPSVNVSLGTTHQGDGTFCSDNSDGGLVCDIYTTGYYADK